MQRPWGQALVARAYRLLGRSLTGRLLHRRGCFNQTRSMMLLVGLVAVCLAVVVGVFQLPAGSFVNDDRGVGVQL